MLWLLCAVLAVLAVRLSVCHSHRFCISGFVLVPCGRLSWLLPAFDRTLIFSHLLTYFLTYIGADASWRHWYACLHVQTLCSPIQGSSNSSQLSLSDLISINRPYFVRAVPWPIADGSQPRWTGTCAVKRPGSRGCGQYAHVKWGQQLRRGQTRWGEMSEQKSCAIAKMSARCTIRQYAHGLKLESPFVPSSTDCWAVRAKINQKRPSWWP